MRVRTLCALIAGLVLVLNSGCWNQRWCQRRAMRHQDARCQSCSAPAADCGCCGAPPLPPLSLTPYPQPLPPGH